MWTFPECETTSATLELESLGWGQSSSHIVKLSSYDTRLNGSSLRPALKENSPATMGSASAWNKGLFVHLFVLSPSCPTFQKVWPNVELSRWIRRGQLQAPVHEGGWSQTLLENQDNLKFHENQDNYNKKIAPFSFDKVKNLNIPVNINVSMSVIDFIKIKEVDHVYILQFRLVLEWYLWDMKVRITKLCMKGTTTE